MSSIRHFVDRFWDLLGSDRREICLELGLISTDEIELPEPERYRRAILRAAERNQVDALDGLVSERAA